MTNMDTGFDIIRSDERVRLIAGLAETQGVSAFMVGGGLRDTVMGRPVNDYDFVLSGAVEHLPREFASLTGGSFFPLDKERGHSRVVTGKGEQSFTYDFAPVRGRDIREDLLLRDFTINSLALPVAREALPPIDPLQGLRDIEKGVIRTCGKGTFDADPLRLLRAVRFSATLGFAIEDDTWLEIVRKYRLLERTAGERIREELFSILSASGIGASLAKLRDSGLLHVIIPSLEQGEGFSGFLDDRIAFTARIERMIHELEEHFPRDRQLFEDHLGSSVEGGITVLPLVKLAAFLAGDGAPERIASCADRIRLGIKARKELKVLCGSGSNFPAMPEGRGFERVMFRFFRDRAPAGPELLLLPLSAGAIRPDLAERLVSYYFHAYGPAEGYLLLSGDEVMSLLNIGSGPELGKIMEQLREAESLGLAATAGEAREFILKNRLTKQETMG